MATPRTPSVYESPLSQYSDIDQNPSPITKSSSHSHRTSLPSPMPSHENISVWSILKQCIGKDLSKITMPIVFNEPLTFLQRLAEYMEYSYLLDKADTAENPVDRLEYVAAFAVSGCATNWERLGKPFNPLLGETFELDMPEKGFSMVCEQVSHHPPISAFHVDSKAYRFHGSIQPKSKFWGKALDVTPFGIINLELLNHNECYTWMNPNCTIHNIIMGKLYIEHTGTMEIRNHTNGYTCILNFRPSGKFGKEVNRVDGFVYDQRQTKSRALYGHWNLAMYSTTPKNYEDSLSKNVTDKMMRRRSSSLSKKAFSFQNILAENPETMSLQPDEPLSVEQMKYAKFVLDLPHSKMLWRYIPKPANSRQMFNFSLFSMILNEMPNNGDPYPPTDSRLRPDLREYESGHIEMASKLKSALEEKQRAVAKYVKSLSPDQLNAIKTDSDTTSPLKNFQSLRSCDIVKGPLWFTCIQNPYFKADDENVDWKFNDLYWARKYSQCPRIFDLPR